MPTEREVISILKQIEDPHTDLNVYDMGLISDIRVAKTSISITYRPTSPFCPLCSQLALTMKRRLEQLKGVKKATVKVVGHVHEEQINKVLAKV
jgi:metal-sulfur cluster biosynthetic enzyme